MKKILFLLILFGVVTCVAAEKLSNTLSVSPESTPAKVDSARFRLGELDPLNLDVLLEMNHSMNENLDEAFKRRLGINAQSLAGGISAYVGREWIPVLGWRLGIGYDINKGRATFFNKSSKIYHFHDIEAFGDLSVDLMDLFAPRREKRMFGLKVLVGVGGLVSFGFSCDSLSHTDPYSTKARLNWGIRAGLASRFRINERFVLGADLMVYGLDDHFNGVAANFPMDARINFALKATWFFPEKEPEKPVEDIFIPIQPLIRLNLPIEAVAMVPMVQKCVIFTKPANLGTKHRSLEGQTYLDFPVNRIEIYPTYRDNPAKLREITESIDVIKLDKTVTIDTIWIHGFASPEGTYSNNIRLAQGRAESLKKYLMDTYRFHSSMIRVTSTPEDWDGLQRYIEDSQLPTKDQLLVIIANTKLTPDKREAELRKILGEKEYNRILTVVYPALRHSDYKVAYTIRDYTLEEAQLLITRNPGALSTHEMYRVAMSYPKGSFKQIEALTVMTELYPDNAEINLNLANALLIAGDLDLAEKYLDRSGELPEAIHARGLLEALRHNYDAAEKYLKRSLELGVEASASVITYPE